MKSKRKSIIFDLDGTLFDTLDDIIVSVKATFENLSLAIPSSGEIKNAIGWGTRQLFLSLMKDHQREMHIDEALKIFSSIYINNIANQTRPYPGVIPVLKALKLKKGYALTLNIMTNKPRMFTMALLKKFDFTCYFESIITPEDLSGLKKPDDRLCSIPVLKNAVLFVGDSEVDMEMAFKCGIPSVFVTYGYGTYNRIKPHIIIDSFNELEYIIDSEYP